MKQSSEDLVAHLKDQVGFLRASGAAYDAGQHSEAKRLASTIRLLVHDTSRSTSLLRQLEVKDALRFVDTANEPVEAEPGILTWTMDFGLAAAGFGSNPPYIAPLGDKDRLEPKPFQQ
jgi:hypothetical protein